MGGAVEMSNILPFAAAAPDRRRKPGAGSAEIVIFPGIRVEYHDRPKASKGSSKRRRQRRRSAKDALSA